MEIRNNWSFDDIKAIYSRPLFELIYEARTIHNHYHDANEVQVCSLISVKTGNCPEDCGYCPQSAKHQTDIDKHNLLSKEEVISYAQSAKAQGATRVCLGAAWRKVKNNKDFDQMVEIVSGVSQLGVEVCCTLGMVSAEQALRLKEAGLYAYNHNLDTSREFYQEIISTRSYDDRLKTLENIRQTNIKVCCGGILGMGETDEDRVAFLHTLATLPEHPESVPINALVPVKGTPLENQKRIEIWDMLRAIATARIIMPGSIIRLSAGRAEMSAVEQAFCFFAGANSIFAGDKLLTTPNADFDDDMLLFEKLSLKPRPSYKGVIKATIDINSTKTPGEMTL